ncbi:MAG: hypothetical protein Q4C52_06140 [Eubacteriales bacterium]|nr:hypothetical protein [Eubacteriales bacterium]
MAGFLYLGERPVWQFYIAFIIMVISTVMMIEDSIQLQHTHEHAHHKLENHNHLHMSQA